VMLTCFVILAKSLVCCCFKCCCKIRGYEMFLQWHACCSRF
jgi:hypothetical protein